MKFKEFMVQSLTVTVGLLIFLIIVYITLQIFTSEGFRKLRSKNAGKVEDLENDDDIEDISDDDIQVL